MSLIREQRRGDRHIDTSAYNAGARAARASTNIFFDPQYFNFQNDITGTFVTLQPSAEFNLGNLNFWWSWVETGAKVKINEGNVIYHMNPPIYPVGETEVELAGNPCFIFVQYERGGTHAGTIETMSDFPVSQTPYVRLPLFKFEAVGGVYGEPQILHMGGDFNFDIVGRSSTA